MDRPLAATPRRRTLTVLLSKSPTYSLNERQDVSLVAMLPNGFVPEGTTVERARQFIGDETVRWSAAIKAAKTVIE